MRRLWSADELGECWTLFPGDLALVAALPDAGKLGLTAQLAFWRQNGRFPDEEADLAPAVVGHLASQIGVQADALDGYDWVGRTGRRHRRAILDHLAVAAFDEAAETRLRRWLADDLLPREPASAALEEEIALWFARERITRPGAYRLDRIPHRTIRLPPAARARVCATKLASRQVGAASRSMRAVSRSSTSPESTLTTVCLLSTATIARIFSIVSVRSAVTLGRHAVPAGLPAPSRLPPVPAMVAEIRAAIRARARNPSGAFC
jgi:hypothetical protein